MLYAVIALSLLTAALIHPVAPEIIPTHWNLSGEPDAWSDTAYGLAIIPAIIIASALLFGMLIRHFGSGDMRTQRAAGWFIVLLLGLLYAIQINQAFTVLGHPVDPLLFFPVIFALFYLGISFLLPRLSSQNPVIGIRTPWTMKNAIVWERTHQAGARTFRIAAGLTLLGAFFPDYLFLFIIGSALGATIWLVIVSYREYRRLETIHG
ncbi:SdpI family protein [Methanocalculus chunghsingensis]|uniref:SdpI family protein n=1 Tax=Methanocalculus chunghsingensis TaxID=156457 RepID=UPI001B8D0F77